VVPAIRSLRLVQNDADRSRSRFKRLIVQGQAGTSTLREFPKRRNEVRLLLSCLVESESALLAGIMIAGLFVDLGQTHSLEELFLNFDVTGIALRKVTKEASRSAIAQRFDAIPEYRDRQVPAHS
jgi:hypothetical protein